MLVINGVSGQMNEISRVIAEQARPQEPPILGVGDKFSKTKIVAGEMKFSDIATFRRGGNDFMTGLLGGFRTLPSESKFRIGENDLDV